MNYFKVVAKIILFYLFGGVIFFIEYDDDGADDDTMRSYECVSSGLWNLFFLLY